MWFSVLSMAAVSIATTTASTAALTDGYCPNSSWHQLGSYCFYISNYAASFDEAAEECRQLSGNLASINDVTEDEYIASFLNPSLVEAWIGLFSPCTNQTCASTQVGWQWSDGTPYDSAVFHEWVSPFEPEASECCGRMYHKASLGWSGKDCSRIYHYVCCKESAEDLSCEDATWTQHNNKCYKLSQYMASFNQALDKCTEIAATLSSVNDSSENAFILDLMNESGASNAWIGLYHNCSSCCDAPKSRLSWEWIDGTSLDANAYTHWLYGEPSGIHRCGHMIKGGNGFEWTARNCSHTLNFVCKAKVQTKATNEYMTSASDLSSLETSTMTPTSFEPSICTNASSPVMEPILPNERVPLAFGVWMGWSECTQTCGGGQRVNFRICSASNTENCPIILPGSCNILGYEARFNSCNTEPCPVDGYWNSWSEWTACSSTCDKGTSRRTRQCLGPSDGGLPCDGVTYEGQLCFIKGCQTIHGTAIGDEEVFKSSDSRLSALTIGNTWVIILLSIVIALLVCDLPILYRHIRSLR